MSVTLTYVKPAIGSLTIDAWISEDHDFTSKITAYPVESGAMISDNILNEPLRLRLTGIVSNSPMQDMQTGDEVPPDRDQSAYDSLMQIRDARAVVTVITGLKKYDNMALESLSIPRTASIGQALQFQASFIQIKIVTSQIVDASSLKNIGSGAGAGAQDQGQSQSDRSKQNSKTISKDGNPPSTAYNLFIAPFGG
jgi:hypothetical protein